MQNGRSPGSRAAGDRRSGCIERGGHRIDPLTGARRAGDGSGTGQEFGNLLHGEARIDQVALRHRHDAVLHAECLEHAHVLDRLRHDTVISGDDQQK